MVKIWRDRARRALRPRTTRISAYGHRRKPIPSLVRLPPDRHTRRGLGLVGAHGFSNEACAFFLIHPSISARRNLKSLPTRMQAIACFSVVYKPSTDALLDTRQAPAKAEASRPFPPALKRRTGLPIRGVRNHLAESRAISRLGLFMKGNAWETASLLPREHYLSVDSLNSVQSCNYFYTIDRRVGELARFRTYL